MDHVITVDGGTTNTRATLWRNGESIGSCARPAGVKDTAVAGSNKGLLSAVSAYMGELLEKNSLGWPDIRCVVAAGMLTSELGIHEVPHLTAPAGIGEFAAGMQSVWLEQVCPLPVWLVPGLKNLAGPIGIQNLGAMDIMRGEEVEAVALFPALPAGESCVLALPGSHTKFIAVDAGQRMTGCATSMTGELLSLLTRGSILAGDLGGAFAAAATLDEEYLRAGYRAARDQGIGKAAFGTRLLGRFGGCAAERLAGYLLGAVLESDVRALSGAEVLGAAADTPVLVAGKEPFATALSLLLGSEAGFRRVCALPPAGESLSGRGCLRVAAERGLIENYGRGEAL